MQLSEYEPCKGCRKPVMNKWSMCLPCRQVEKTCGCGEKYRGRPLSDQCPACRKKAHDRRTTVAQRKTWNAGMDD